MSVATNGPMGGLGYVKVEDARDAGYLAHDVLADAQMLTTPLADSHWTRKHLPLNQKQTPMCVGYAHRGLLYAGPVENEERHPTAKEIYAGAQLYDGIKGPHDGSNARGANKWLQLQGIVKNYVWMKDVATCERWAALVAPFCIGIPWYSSFDEAPYGLTTKTQNVLSITPDATVRGWHELLVLNVFPSRRLFEVPNSWGKPFGNNGTVLMSYDVLDHLLGMGGDAVAPTELLIKAATFDPATMVVNT